MNIIYTSHNQYGRNNNLELNLHTMTEFIVLDFETTGFNPPDRVVEIGAVKISGNVALDSFQTLVNPGVWNNHAARVHQIPHNEVLLAPLSSVAFRKFFDFAGVNQIIAHNAPFEMKFLNYEAGLLGRKVVNEFHCTLSMARARVPKKLVQDYKLSTLLNHFGIRPTGPMHRALPDAVATAALFIKLSEL